jgi:hypothetical protein
VTMTGKGLSFGEFKSGGLRGGARRSNLELQNHRNVCVKTEENEEKTSV